MGQALGRLQVARPAASLGNITVAVPEPAQESVQPAQASVRLVPTVSTAPAPIQARPHLAALLALQELTSVVVVGPVMGLARAALFPLAIITQPVEVCLQDTASSAFPAQHLLANTTVDVAEVAVGNARHAQATVALLGITV